MPCRICRNSDGNERFAVREMMFGTREVFVYFRCARCGCLQIATIPEDMSVHYPPTYYSFGLSPERLFASGWKNLLKRPRDRFAVLGKGLFGRLLYALLPNPNLRKLSHVGLTRDARVLEVGCGSGTLLYTLRNFGMTNLLGVDAFLPDDVTYDNGLRILRRELDDVEGTWDLVMFNHSLEHMPDQIGTMQTVSRLLAPGGTCLVRVPTVSSYAWEHYGVNWVQLDAPRHLYLHSVESIGLLAASAGLTLARTLYDSTELQFWGSEQYAKDVPLRSERSWSERPERSLFTPGEIKAYRKRAQQLNREGRGDQAAFILTKP